MPIYICVYMYTRTYTHTSTYIFVYTHTIQNTTVQLLKTLYSYSFATACCILFQVCSALFPLEPCFGVRVSEVVARSPNPKLNPKPKTLNPNSLRAFGQRCRASTRGPLPRVRHNCKKRSLALHKDSTTAITHSPWEKGQ